MQSVEVMWRIWPSPRRSRGRHSDTPAWRIARRPRCPLSSGRSTAPAAVPGARYRSMRDARAAGAWDRGRPPGFEPGAAFAANFAEHGEVGASVCVYRDGKKVVELWGGLADREADRPWRRETLAMVFSTTKGVARDMSLRSWSSAVRPGNSPSPPAGPSSRPTARRGSGSPTCSRTAARRGGGPLHAGGGVRDHSGVRGAGEAGAAVAADSAAARAATAGSSARSCAASRASTSDACWRASRRRSGSSASSSWDCRPSSTRVARLIPAPQPADERERELRARFMGPETRLGRVLSGPSGLFEYNEMWMRPRALRGARDAVVQRHRQARALARLRPRCVGPVDGVHVLAPETVDRFRAPQVEGPDLVILMRRASGSASPCRRCSRPECPASVLRASRRRRLAGLRRSDARIRFGYAMNQMRLGLTGDARAASLVRATYAPLARPLRRPAATLDRLLAIPLHRSRCWSPRAGTRCAAAGARRRAAAAHPPR